MQEVLNDGQWQLIDDLAARIVPDCAGLSADQHERFRDLIAQALSARPAKVQKQFKSFLGVIKWLPAVRFGRSWDRLPAQRQDAVLRWFEAGPVVLFRRGFWGVRTFVLMGYYGQTDMWPRWHYAPDFDGNAKLAKWVETQNQPGGAAR